MKTGLGRARAAAAAALLGSSACAPGTWLCRAPAAPAERARSARQRGLLNPLIDLAPDADLADLKPFEHKVARLIDQRLGDGRAIQISVFWQDLDNGQTFNIAAGEKFVPASLLKVPIMIAVLKKAEAEPGLLERRLVYAPNERVLSFQFRPDAPPLERGREYSVDELLRAMVADSDNGAALILLDLAGPDAMDRVYRDFGITIPDFRGPMDSVTVREYAALFRTLYNAAYLDRAMSARALGYLARSRFAGGLVAGAPAGWTVAHKYGERELGDVRQLHDCGIVYQPQEPYVLCVMTRGKDYESLVEVIASIARLVSSEVDAQAGRPR